MRMSKAFIPTLKEDPKDAEVISHKLLVRAGFIRKVSSGLYNILPLGTKVVEKIKNIIRKYMNEYGAQEIIMPIMTPSELWIESGRWNVYGKEMIKFKDRHDRDYALGPTHEEVVTDLIRKEVKSYKDLPLNLYQIGQKFRDEIRPRFGLMRAREFIMKDAYSFAKDENEAKEEYFKMYEAYKKIFDEIGLNYEIIEADTGEIGGKFSHEFVVLADSGESKLIKCKQCPYCASTEIAKIGIKIDDIPFVPFKILEEVNFDLEKYREKVKSILEKYKETLEKENLPQKEEVYTPNQETIEDVAKYLNLSKEDTAKAMVYIADGKPILIFLRGDYEVNETKLKRALKAKELSLADEKLLKELSLEKGYIGPLLSQETLEKIKEKQGLIIGDISLLSKKALCFGANKKDYHIKNLVMFRDYKLDTILDISEAQGKDWERCPECLANVNFKRGIEVGHIFMLGDRYSKAMNATFVDRDGKEKYIIMGCYGIGVTRIMAASVEQSFDKDGIIWPLSIAPYQVHLICVNPKDEKQKSIAEELYKELLNRGYEVLYDDREERPGFKFKDADLIGIPIQVIVGKKVKDNKVEVKVRKTQEKMEVELDKIFEYINNTINMLK